MAQHAEASAYDIQPVAAVDAAGTEEIDRRPVRTYWQLVRRRFFRHRLAVIGALVLTLLAVGAVTLPIFYGEAWFRTSLYNVGGPSLQAPLGYTPDTGVNVFARLARATFTSLQIGVAAVLIIVIIGITIGAIAGFAGGFVDNLMMRFVDVVLSLPTLFIILMLVALWGRGNVWVVIIAIGITGWTTAARLVRAEFLALREVDYVQAARALGASPARIIMRHMLPPALAPVVVAAALGVADSVITEGALSFLGFGISPPEASLGNMLTDAREYFVRAPILVVYPGSVLVLIVLSASFLGDGLRDALDPRQRIES